MASLSDMDNFTLAELDDFISKELDDMSYAQLLTAVQAKYKIASEQCDKNAPLSDEQIQAVVEIIRIQMKEQCREPLSKTLTIGVAINAIWALICFLTNAATEHLPEIMKALEQSYILLEQLIQQIPK